MKRYFQFFGVDNECASLPALVFSLFALRCLIVPTWELALGAVACGVLAAAQQHFRPVARNELEELRKELGVLRDKVNGLAVSQGMRVK